MWAEILDLGPAVRDPNFLRFAACGFPGGLGRSARFNGLRNLLTSFRSEEIYLLK